VVLPDDRRRHRGRAEGSRRLATVYGRLRAGERDGYASTMPVKKPIESKPAIKILPRRRRKRQRGCSNQNIRFLGRRSRPSRQGHFGGCASRLPKPRSTAQTSALAMARTAERKAFRMTVIRWLSILVGARSLRSAHAVNLEGRRRFRPRPANPRQLSNLRLQGRLPQNCRRCSGHRSKA
jgi:hypothetical protein